MSPNYGAALQTFALSRYLSVNGNECKILDYKCAGNSDEFSVKNQCQSKKWYKKFVKKILFYAFSCKSYSNKLQRFEEFKKDYLNIISLDEAEHCDVVLCGSDQIWNPNITNGFDEMFFGARSKIESKVAASYAASVGSISEIMDSKEQFLAYLSHLDYIGVREASLKKLIDENIEKKCNINMDPTFLLQKDDYISWLGIKDYNDVPFILVYELRKDDDLMKIANAIAKETGYVIKRICGFYELKREAKDSIYNAGPIEFIRLVNGASYVVTNSFHGLAFSLIFSKQFVIGLPKSRSDRILDLLELFGLLDRAISGIDELELDLVNKSIEYTEIKKKIQKLSERSKEYLSEVIRATE